MTLPVSQYKTNPLLCDQNMNVNISGMIIIIFACAGSTLVVGVIFCCTNIEMVINIARTGMLPKI